MVAWRKEAIAPGKAARQILDYVREDDAETFIAGAALVNTAGVWAEAANDPAVTDGIARKDARNLAADDPAGQPNLPIIPLSIGSRIKGNFKEALSTGSVGVTVGLLDETGDWVFSTTAANKDFKIVGNDPRAAQADTYTIVEVEKIS